MIKAFKQDGHLVIHKQEDVDPVLHAVRVARDAPGAPMSDSWHIATLPTVLIEKWLNEEGLQLSDREAVRDMIKRKLLSGEFNAFRVHEGTY